MNSVLSVVKKWREVALVRWPDESGREMSMLDLAIESHPHSRYLLRTVARAGAVLVKYADDKAMQQLVDDSFKTSSSSREAASSPSPAASQPQSHRGGGKTIEKPFRRKPAATSPPPAAAESPVAAPSPPLATKTVPTESQSQ